MTLGDILKGPEATLGTEGMEAMSRGAAHFEMVHVDNEISGAP